MTFLPILERELRVRARSRANYWGRFAVGALGLAVGLPPLMWSSALAGPKAVGREVFNGLVSGAFLLCCAACLLTADCISRERREGTLGLLLLTRVREFEVLLGKLASNGLASVLGLAAFLPVLMLPILAGGISGGEAARKGLVLFDTLFVSLSAGLWASARGSERFRAGRAAVLVVAGLALAPIVLGWIFYNRLRLASPLGAMIEAADLAYRTSASPFWLSLGLVQLVGWALLFGAMARLNTRSGSGQDTEDSGPIRTRPKPASGGAAGALSAAPERCVYCGHLNEGSASHCVACGTALRPQPPEEPRSSPSTISSAPTALHWLLLRRRSLRPMLWLAAALGFLRYGFLGLGSRLFGVGSGVYLGISSAFAFAVAAATGAIFAWVASRFFVEARRTGELELLATTPLGAEAIVSTQWSILKRWVAGPVLLMLAPLVLQGLFVFHAGYVRPNFARYYYFGSLVFSALHIVLRVGALCWVGLWLGLRAGTQARAILWTLVLVQVPPYVLSTGLWLFGGRFVASMGSPWILGLLAPQLVTLAFFLWLIGLAGRQLRKEIAGAEPLSLRQVLAGTWPGLTAAIQKARHWPDVQDPE